MKRTGIIETKSWVDNEVSTDPFVFRWTVVKKDRDESNGEEPWYDWRESLDGEQRLYPRCTPGWGFVRYVPSPTMYREFISLDGSLESIQGFAGRYGDLFGNSWDPGLAEVGNGPVVGATSLGMWRTKLRDMQALVKIWDQIHDKKRRKELSGIIVRNDNEICYVRGLNRVPLATGKRMSAFRANDLVRPARAALQWEINKRLADFQSPSFVVPQIVFTPDYHQRIIFRPCNLLAEMWIRFAQTVAGEMALKKCAAPNCSKYFQVGPGGDRSHKDACDARCRQAKSRELRRESLGTDVKPATKAKQGSPGSRRLNVPAKRTR